MKQQPMEWKPDALGPRDARGLRFAIVVARFHQQIAEKLLEGARAALRQTGAESHQEFQVPGAFELPFAAQRLARTGDYDAIIALGAVIRGETPHFDYVAGEAARGLQQVALEADLPVAFGVLTTDTLAQAEARAGGKDGNKGFDAAMAAIEMARFASSLSTSVSSSKPSPSKPSRSKAGAART